MAMHDVVLSSNINVVQHANLFLVTANEVTSIMENQQWISVHVCHERLLSSSKLSNLGTWNMWKWMLL
jgi:hypothetical protein